MILNRKIDGWLSRLLWYESDTQETLDLKVYLVGNMIIPAVIITLNLILILILKVSHLFLLISPLVLSMIITVALLLMIKRGIKWFLYFYYGGYIVICGLIVLELGGLPNSCGVWGGAFICFMHALAVKSKQILIINASIYCICLIIIGFSFPYLSPAKEWSPKINNIFFTINEIWMCLYLVKSFYDSIIIKTDEAKKRTAHLQELDLMKSKLYANIAHEFRTPLTLIRGNAEEIEEHYSGETNSWANCIIQNSNKILFLINQMLNLSKIEEGHVSLNYIQCDLVAFVRFIVNSFQGYAESRKIELHYQPRCRQLMMDIETEKLEESLSNLLSNAIKYTPEGGDVYISIRPLNSTKTTNLQVEISVQDTGIGIPEDQLDKIFIRFYRVENKRFPYQEGTGIGLTLVSEYIKLMHGSIRVNSTLNIGSEFIITLPVAQNAKIGELAPDRANVCAQEIADSQSREVKHTTNRPRLLIIEDNSELTNYLVGLLEIDYQILTAENGTQGITHAIKYIPDIILSDVMMPGKDGYQVCKELKKDFRTNHIPIVLLTARADNDSRIRGLEHGADVYLTKPFNKRELMVCLNNLLVQRDILRLKFSNQVLSKETIKKEAGLNENFMNKVIVCLEKNYQNDRYGIRNLYFDMKISRVQLHRKLTALTGQPASGFIRNFRLQKARNLLLETCKNVSDIAYEVGFADANYFGKAFISEYGLSATDYRKSFT